MKTKISLYTFYTAAMVAFVIVERYVHGRFVEHINIFSDFTIAPYLGMILGAFLLALLYSYFVETKKIKPSIVIVSVVIIILLFLWIPFLRETIIPAFYDAISANSYNSTIKQFFQGIVVGGTMGFFLYSSLAIFKTPLPAAFFYLNFVVQTAGYRDNESIYMIIALLAIAVFITTYMLRRYAISVKKWIPYLLVLLLLLGVGSIFAYKIAVAVLAEHQRKIDLIEAVRRNQQKIPVNKPDEIPIDEPVGSRTVELVAFYQAPEPLYLKYELFKISQDSDKLRIVPINPYNVESHGYFRPSNDIPAKKARVIFAHFPMQGLLSPERVLSYDTAMYSYTDGVLTSRYRSTEEQTTSYEFSYITYDANVPYIYNFAAGIDYTSISPASESYQRIAALTHEITKGKHTDLEKAHAIENYFHNNFTYTLNPHFEDKVNPMDDFLFDTKKGYCVQYAVATALMLDIAGVQSRMVGGYYSSLFVPGANAYVVVSRQAHVWNEIYVSSYGWVTIDSTPSAPSSTNEHGGVQLSEEEMAQVQVLLKAAAPVVSFDDFYDNPKDGLPLDPGKVIDDSEREKREKELEEQIKREEERRKLEEEEKKKREEQQVMMKKALFIFSGVVVFGGLSILVYLYVKNPEQYKWLILRFRVQLLDRNLRLKIIKKYSLPQHLLFDSSKYFQAKLPKDINYKTELKKYYQLLNKVLYAKFVTKVEVKNLFYLGRELSRKIMK